MTAEDSVSHPMPPLSPGDVREIFPGVWVVAHKIAWPPGFQNAYALADEDDAGRPTWTIVDPGFKICAERWVELSAAELASRAIGRVVVTHHHPDHVGAAGALQQQFDAALWTSRTAWLFARMLQLDRWTTPPPEAELFYRRAGYDEAMAARWRKRAAANFAVTVAPLPLGYRQVRAGETLRIGDRDWRVLTGDGHAPEHLLLHCEQAGWLLSGDQILPRISPPISVYPTEPDGDPLGDWLESCARLRATFGNDPHLTALPGHGDPFVGVGARLDQMIDKHRRALDRLHAHLSEAPRSAVECWSAIYRRRIEGALEGIATGEALGCLNRLVTEGRAIRDLDDRGVWRYRAI